MLRLISVILIVLLCPAVFSQNWSWTEMDSMPMRTSNNAVCEAIVGGEQFVYSFGGIDTSKIYSGIHARSFKYIVATDSWSEIDSLPDATPKIASAASFVNGKIYILGGYHVAQGGSETSSNKVHIYNPLIDAFEGDGAPIPIPIDDQVQCVYKDSLIFLVTGWSNTGNVPDVQIYNPLLNQWQVGTSTTNNAFYTSFGASGYIIGDTLYYHGGASGASFGAKRFMRKGFINPINPTDITWELMSDAPGDPGYRSACSSVSNTIFWIGGSNTSYNYDGIAYNGSGGVEPSARILHFNNLVYEYVDQDNQPYGVMDLRGIAKLSNSSWIICGGMDTSQIVSNRTFLLTSENAALNEKDPEEFIVKNLKDRLIIETVEFNPAELIDCNGKTIRKMSASNSFDLIKSEFQNAVYFFQQSGKRIRIVL